MRKALILVCSALMAGCASNSNPGYQGTIQIVAASQGQPVEGAQCAVIKGNQRWDMVAPDVVPVGAPDSDLRVACSKPGFRDSEVLYRPSPYSYPGSGYGSGYPNVGIGMAGGSGGASGVGIGINFPVGGAAAAGPVGGYPTSITVEMTPQ